MLLENSANATSRDQVSISNEERVQHQHTRKSNYIKELASQYLNNNYNKKEESSNFDSSQLDKEYTVRGLNRSGAAGKSVHWDLTKELISEVVYRGEHLPLDQYPLNEDDQPELVKKRPNTKLDYIQQMYIRYLRPPTPPQPGEILIRQLSDTQSAPEPPVIIRAQPPRPGTPEPIVLREAPPPMPEKIERKVIKIVDRPKTPKKVIIEKLPALPPKPQPIIIERWLPYEKQKRKVIFRNVTGGAAGDLTNIVNKTNNNNNSINNRISSSGNNQSQFRPPPPRRVQRTPRTPVESVINWKGDTPINEFLLNNDIDPEIITKQTNLTLDYIQEIGIR
jgi:hypothetical protein